MKVYELMKELEDAAAGAEVKLVGWFDDGEIAKHVTAVDVEDDDSNPIVQKRLSFDAEGVEQSEDDLFIYLE